MENTPINLNELFEKQLDFCKKIFAECGEVQPMWVGQAEDGTLIPITGVFGSSEEKDAAAEAIRSIFRKFKVIRYVSMLESWMVSAHKDQLKTIKYTPPSQHPDREEVIIVTGEEAGQGIFGFYKIIRKDGEKPTLSEFERHDDANSGLGEGRFSNLLPEQESRVYH